MCHHSSCQPDMNELIAEAFLLLAGLDPPEAAVLWGLEGEVEKLTEEELAPLTKAPPLATVLWLHEVEERSEEELAHLFGRSPRRIRGWLNGYTRHDGHYIWGAKDWMKHILDLFLEALRCNGSLGLEEVRCAYWFARKLNPWGTPCLAALLDIFWQAMAAEVLAHVLACLDDARHGNCYTEAILTLLELSEDPEQLHWFFEGLSLVPVEGCHGTGPCPGLSG